MIKKAVILAAGMGLRMKEMGETIPKGFLQFDEIPIIEHSLKALLSVGIEEILIVTGHRREYFENLKAIYSEVLTVENVKFAETGTMYSLWCARDFIDSDFILLESDLIYDAEFIPSILKAPHQDCLLLSGTTQGGDEVFVEAVGERVTQITKDLDSTQTLAGEYVGIAKISKSFYEKLSQTAEPLFEKFPKLSYDMDCMVRIAKDHPIHYFKIEGLNWAEIDDLKQLERAKDVWDKIQKGQ